MTIQGVEIKIEIQNKPCFLLKGEIEKKIEQNKNRMQFTMIVLTKYIGRAIAY